MKTPLVSCLMLTIDRFELTSKTLGTNLQNAGHLASWDHEIELLIADNGSKDRRIVDHIALDPRLAYHRINKSNEGCARAFNQLYLRAKGDYICLLGNDIELPPGWLTEMVGYADGVPNSGIIGMDWGHGGLPPYTTKIGSNAHWLTPTLDKVFGVWLMRRAVIETIGFFHEGFHPYGLEDSDFNNRVNLAGFNSLYVPAERFRSNHVGTHDHDSGEYRKMKDASLGANLALLNDRCAFYHQRGIVEPLPPKREPLWNVKITSGLRSSSGIRS